MSAHRRVRLRRINMQAEQPITDAIGPAQTLPRTRPREPRRPAAEARKVDTLSYIRGRFGSIRRLADQCARLLPQGFREMLISQLGFAMVRPSGDWEASMVSTGPVASVPVSAKSAKQVNNHLACAR